MITASTIQGIIDALGNGKAPQVDPEEIPCFGAAALENSPVIKQIHLAGVLANLTSEDIPTLKRALASLELNDQAWLGFKIILDAEKYVVEDPISPARGAGLDPLSTISFANEGKDIVCSRPWNERDRFQMLDVTRGPSMHTDQYAGVTWCSIPLFRTNRVLIYGAGDVSVYLARYAQDCGFTTAVIDDDAAFLTEERFPVSERIFVDELWSDLANVEISSDDYCVCVSRGHVHDVDSIVHAAPSAAFYVGMMGNVGKNADVFARAIELGVTQEQIDAVHAPIGIKIADKTPQEIAISIIAELIDVRGKERKRVAQAVAKQLS